MKIEDRPLDKITPYAGNPRIHEEAVDAVAESIRRFGFQQPIVVDEEGVIIVGHARLKAAYRLELKTAPVLVATGLSETDAAAYRIADNKTAELSVWDDELLRAELTNIDDQDIDWTALGFEVDEMEALFDTDEEVGDGDDDGGGNDPETYTVIVQVKDEKAQAKLMNRLQKEGFTCSHRTS